MEQRIAGRDEEKRILDRILRSGRPEFVAVYGRRRIGKTFLITEYCRDTSVFFEMTGSPKATNADQLRRFGEEIEKTFQGQALSVDPQSWEDAFAALLRAVTAQLKNTPQRPIVIFLDELPWLDKQRSGFLGALDFYWNRHFSKPDYHSVKVIICGSAASWMIKKVIRSKGGLHNRITQKIDLQPFTLKEVATYLESRDIRLERSQILELYMAVGGVPFYLTFVQKGMSVRQLINDHCFTKDGFLFDEYETLFRSLFEKYASHDRIVKTLARSRKGCSREQIAQKTGMSSGGELSLCLQELEQSGFIIRLPLYGKKAKDSTYRLHDEYVTFYLKWIEPMRSRAEKNTPQNYWMQQANTPSWNAWAGFAFEDICFKHISEIRKALGINGIITYHSSWHTPGGKGIDDDRGVQIDLLIDRADRVVNICEIKYSQDSFEMTRQYKDELKRKVSTFRRLTNTRRQIYTTLITTYGASQNDAYIACVDNQITSDAFFA